MPAWIVKLFLGLALVGFLAFEIANPVFIRIQIDDVANRAANEAARVLDRTRSADRARVEAEDIVAGEDAELAELRIDDDGTVHVTVTKHAKSYLLERVGALESWYDVRVEAVSVPRQ